MHPSSREKPPRAAFFVPAFRATPPVPSPHRMGTRKNPALDYQSERHCSKTGLCRCRCSLPLDYQSERHCSKTSYTYTPRFARWITSQNDTAPKRGVHGVFLSIGWITSQNDTAPKRDTKYPGYEPGWITSQNDTAPKPTACASSGRASWITSQNDTAPKPSSTLHLSA